MADVMSVREGRPLKEKNLSLSSPGLLRKRSGNEIS